MTNGLGVATEQRADRPRSALAEMSRATSRELLRNKKLLASMFFMFGFFLILIVVLDRVLAGNDDVPGGDYLRLNLSTAIVIGYLSIVVTGTALPLVALRQNGTLRLLGTTPLRRMTFILAQSPVRFALGVIEAGIVVAVAGIRGYIDFAQLLSLCVTLVLGLAMLFAFGYLLACRLRNAEVVNQLTGFIPVLVLATAGTALPMWIIPDWGQVLMNAFPTSWFIHALGADLTGIEPFTSIYVLWGMMAAVTLGAALLAARLFSWDQGDE